MAGRLSDLEKCFRELEATAVCEPICGRRSLCDIVDSILSQSAIIIEYLARPTFVKKAAGIRESFFSDWGISHMCGIIGILGRNGIIAVPSCSAITTASISEAWFAHYQTRDGWTHELDLRPSVETW